MGGKCRAWSLVALVACTAIEPDVDSNADASGRPGEAEVSALGRDCLAHEYPIIFTSTRGESMNGLELYSMNLTGGVRQVASAPRFLSPIWSPDGQDIAFRHLVGNVAGVSIWSQIQLVAADGSERVELTAPESLPFDGSGILLPTGPSWSSDGQTLAYAATDGANGYRVWLIARQGGEPRRLAPELEASHHSASWSPQGSQIVYVLEKSGVGDLWLRDLEQPDLAPINLSQGRVRMPRWPRWSPDARRLAFSGLNPESGAAGAGAMDLYVLDIETFAITQLTDDDTPDLYPVWSPDGRVLLVSRGVPSRAAEAPTPDTLALDLWLLPLEDPAHAERLTQQGWMNLAGDWFSGSCRSP